MIKGNDRLNLRPNHFCKRKNEEGKTIFSKENTKSENITIVKGPMNIFVNENREWQKKNRKRKIQAWLVMVQLLEQLKVSFKGNGDSRVSENYDIVKDINKLSLTWNVLTRALYIVIYLVHENIIYWQIVYFLSFYCSRFNVVYPLKRLGYS